MDIIQNNESFNIANDPSKEKDAFANRVIEEVTAMKTFSNVLYDATTFSLQLTNSAGNFTVKLASLRHACEHSGAVTEATVVKDWLSRIPQAEALQIQDFAAVQKNLIPIIRSRLVIPESAQLIIRQHHIRTLSKTLPFGGDAVVMIGIDMGNTILRVDPTMLSKWEKTFDECMSIALKNLASRSPSKFKKIAKGVYCGSWDDGFESSRLLLPSMFARSIKLRNSVIMVPDENVLLSARADDEEGLLNMVEIARQLMSHARRAVSSKMYRYIGGVLTEFQPKNPAVAEATSRLNKEWAHTLYASMKPAIDEYITPDDGYIHFSEYNIFAGKNTNSLHSFSTFPVELLCAFPIADYFLLSLSKEEKDGYSCYYVAAKWDAVKAIMGDAWEMLDCFPPRYKTLRRLTEGDLNKLKLYKLEEL